MFSNALILSYEWIHDSLQTWRDLQQSACSPDEQSTETICVFGQIVLVSLPYHFDVSGSASLRTIEKCVYDKHDCDADVRETWERTSHLLVARFFVRLMASVDFSTSSGKYPLCKYAQQIAHARNVHILYLTSYDQYESFQHISWMLDCMRIVLEVFVDLRTSGKYSYIFACIIFNACSE